MLTRYHATHRVMGMKSLRIEDNRGLAHASQLAKSRNAHLVVVFFISPGDWKMHDRAPQRIDFVLRNLAEVKKQLDELHIPLVLHTQKKRTEIPKDIAKFAKEWGVTNVVGNIEYEVDECWRDIATIKELSKSKVHVDFLEDVYVVPAGVLKTGQGNQYSVFSPWNRSWTSYLSSHLDLVEESPLPEANDQSIRKDKTLSSLFGKNNEVPQSVEGFECDNVDYMKKLWPAGSHAARTVLSNFIKRKGGENGMEAPATGDCWDDVGPNAKESRIGRYGIGRNLVSENGSSRLSPYLSAGVISARACLRATMDLEKGKLKVGRGTGVEMWNTEISFRDFYGHVLAAWPRVSMQRNYILKYEAVVWENNEEHFQRWCEGKTGYPLIDAGMRQLAHSSWQHNRARMACAMFLTKHLLCDWRWGEKHYARHLIDSDLASNNAGWQWSASTGTDPQPYFRVFNPLSQSEKCDPNGEYIRHWLPELRGVKGAAVHDPFNRLSRGEFEKLDYPKPIVEHKAARERAMARFKDPGSS